MGSDWMTLWQYPMILIFEYLVTARQMAPMGLEWLSRMQSGQYFSISLARLRKIGMIRSPWENPDGPTVSPVVCMMPKRATASTSALCQAVAGPCTPPSGERSVCW